MSGTVRESNAKLEVMVNVANFEWFFIKITLLRVIPTMTFQNSLLTPLLSEAFVTGLLPNYPNHLFHLAGHCACQSVKQDINMSVGHVK